MPVITMAVIGAALGVSSAIQGRRANKRTAADIQRDLLTTQAQMDRSRVVASAQLGQRMARLSAQVGAMFAETGGQTPQLVQQAVAAASLREQRAIDEENKNQTNRVYSEASQRILSLVSKSPVLGGIEGGLQGLQMGLNIQGGLNSAARQRPTTPRASTDNFLTRGLL